ncbi:hypothetical protein GCM10010361_61960 [Streptomyces olivaceiscleroticus]|uniref:Uncharacterized protein n=1 Tax=Streptomyces olivaceiscleroticus TaxID=68245 RepID=A0ABN1B2E1_9ACTN
MWFFNVRAVAQCWRAEALGRWAGAPGVRERGSLCGAAGPLGRVLAAGEFGGRAGPVTGYGMRPGPRGGAGCGCPFGLRVAGRAATVLRPTRSSRAGQPANQRTGSGRRFS